MKICIIGDQHFRFQLPYSAAVKDGRKEEWNNVINKIYETALKSDAVVLLGDNLNSRHNHSSVNKAFIDFVRKLGTGRMVYILAGNHERFGKDTAIDFLKGMDFCKVFTEPSMVTMNWGVTASFLPFMTPGSLDEEDLPSAKKKIMDFFKGGDVFFHHHVISDSTRWEEHLNEFVLPREELEAKYTWVIGGHIHDPQKLSDKSYITGNIFTHNIGEHEKFIWVLDTIKKEMNSVKLPVRGIYSCKWEDNLEEIPDNSIVKCLVTKKGTDIEKVKETLSRFDAHVIVEKYPSEREKVDLGETGSLDLSIDNLLGVYAKARKVPHKDLKDAMKLLNV